MDAHDIAFIGGGNMASALIGGLLKAGHAPQRLRVVEPAAAQRALLAERFGVTAQAGADECLARATVVVWAVKPQYFAEAAGPCAPHVGAALQLSVMAGVRSAALVAATGSERVVRAMPNTPALIGQGIAGLYARPAVSADERRLVERLFAPTGQSLWLLQEEDLDAVTALSGSGPAYVFYVLEALQQAAVQMGLDAAQGRRLAEATVAGAAALAAQSPQSLATLREQVTSKGGTTQAALAVLAQRGVDEALQAAVLAARDRARELAQTSG